MDNYIDQHETLSYGQFTIGQLESLVLGVDPAMDPTVHLLIDRLSAACTTMTTALHAAGDVGHGAHPKENDPVDTGRDLLRRVCKYADSRPNGEVIKASILGGQKLGTLKKRRPVKLSAALAEAIAGVAKHKAALPEADKWTADLTAAKKELDEAHASHKIRKEKSTMAPEVAAAREEWLNTYAGVKMVVEGILKMAKKQLRMSDIFDDLADVHRAPGVSS